VLKIKTKLALFATLVAMPAIVPVWAADHTKLSPDGFPADWKADDFHIDSISPTASATVAVPQPKAGATAYRIDQLPKVKSDVAQPIENKYKKADETAAATSPTVAPAVVLPKQADGDAGDLPKTIEELNGYGPLREKIGGDKTWNSPVIGSVRKGSGNVAKADTFDTFDPQNVLDGRRNVAAWVQNDAFRRILMTRGPVPQPVSAVAAVSGTVSATLIETDVLPTLPSGTVPLPWLAARAQTLAGMGYAEAADSLWRAIPAGLRLSHQALAQGWVASRLLAGQTGEACQLAANQVLNSGDSPAAAFWRQGVLVCQAISGQRDALGLSLQLAEASHPKADAFLLAVATAVREDRPVSEKIKPPARIEMLPAAIVATYPALIRDEWLPRLPDVVWRRLVRTEGLPWKLRAAAAELLAAQTHAAADVEVVQAFYAVANIEGIDWYDPIGAAGKVYNLGEPVRARALLWQAANGRAANNGLRALSWQKWAMRASEAGLAGLLPAMSPDMARIKPSAELAWLAPVAQSLVWQRGQDATDWLKALQQNASVAPELKDEAKWLALQAGMMTREGPGKKDWQDWLNLTDWNEASRLRAARLLSAAHALGHDMPIDLMPLLQQKLGEFNESVAATRPFWVQAIDAAVKARQAGTALDLLRQFAPGEDPQSPPILAVRIDALHELGLDTEAREMAAASLMAPLVSEAAEPPAPKIVSGKKPVEKRGKGSITIKLPPVSNTTPVSHVTPGGVLMPPEKQ
jgi:hypothetical protein